MCYRHMACTVSVVLPTLGRTVVSCSGPPDVNSVFARVTHATGTGATQSQPTDQHAAHLTTKPGKKGPHDVHRWNLACILYELAHTALDSRDRMPAVARHAPCTSTPGRSPQHHNKASASTPHALCALASGHGRACFAC